MSNKECATLFAVVFVILLSLYEFSLGVSEAVYLSRYSEFSSGCQGIWGWIVAACVINICVPVFTCCGLTGLSDDEKKDKSFLLQALQIGQLVIAIWSCVTYYNISNSCQDFWTSNAPQLWTFVMIHYVMFWISIGIIGLSVLLSCTACWVSICCGSKASTTFNNSV